MPTITITMPEEQNMERSIGRLEGKLDLLVQSVNALSESFRSLEQGRLSKLELAFNTIKTEVELKAKSNAMIYAVVTSIIASLVVGIISHYIFTTPPAASAIHISA